MSSVKETAQRFPKILNNQENINPNQSDRNSHAVQESAALLKEYQDGSSQEQGLNHFQVEQSSSLSQKSLRSQKHPSQSSVYNIRTRKDALKRIPQQKRQRTQNWMDKTQTQQKRRKLIRTKSYAKGNDEENLNFSKSTSEDEWSSDSDQKQVTEPQVIHQIHSSACEEAMKRRLRILNNLDSIQLRTENFKDMTNLSEIIERKIFKEEAKAKKELKTSNIQKNEEQINQQENEMNEHQNFYKTFEDLGEGSFGKVLRQLHLPTRKFYALKILKGHNKKRKRRMAKREFKILQTIKQADSPILLQIKDLKDSPNFFARMEYGYGTLHNFLRFCQKTNRMKLWKDDDILTLYIQLLSQLKVLKELNIFHSDIKPENIIISSEGFSVISDFGVSILLKNLGRQKITIQGTVGYYMPEIETVLDEKRKRKRKRKCSRSSCEYDPMEQDLFACEKIIRKIIRLRKKSGSFEDLLKKAPRDAEGNLKLFETRNCLRIYNDHKEAYHVDLLDQIYETYNWNKKSELIYDLIDYCQFDQVYQWVQEKIRILEEKKSMQSQEYIYLNFLKARALIVQRKFQEALDDYKKCEEAISKYEGKIDSKYVSRLYSEMGEAAVMNYDFELARKYIDKSFEIKLQDGNPTIELAQDYWNLACIEYFEGNREKAAENSKKGLELFKPANINTRYLDLKNIFGISLEALGRYDQAYETFQDLYQQYCSVYGETHSKITYVLSNIAMIFDNTGRPKEALSYNQRSLKIKKELFLSPNRNQLFAYTLINMAVCYAYLGELGEALRCARESVEIIQNSQNYDPFVPVWKITIAEICIALEQYEDAKKYLQQYLDSYDKMPTSRRKFFLQICFVNWDYYVHKRKGIELALEKHKNRVKYLTKNPQTNPVEAFVHQRFAIIEILNGNYKDGLRCLRKAHEIIDQNLIDNDPSFFSEPEVNLHIFFQSRLEEALEKDLKAFCEEYYEKCKSSLIVVPDLSVQKSKEKK